MANTHLKKNTREQLKELMGHEDSFDDVVTHLLTEHRLLVVVQRENELLRDVDTRRSIT